MKKYYFFLLFSFVLISHYGQTNCIDAEPDLNYAYSHIKSAYDANNLTHIKYYSNRSFEAFERVNKILEDCNCGEAFDYAYQAQKLLFKVPNSETFEDSRFYVKRARELAQKTINELELCSKLTLEDEALVELEYEHQKLIEQQEKLKQKEAEIKLMLQQKEAKELRLKKEKLIALNEEALLSTINSLNKMLEACECNSRISMEAINNEAVLSKSINQVKSYYLESIKKITSDYLTTLNQCQIK